MRKEFPVKTSGTFQHQLAPFSADWEETHSMHIELYVWMPIVGQLTSFPGAV